jgi:predicted amidohydrolase YtcJ
LAEAVAAYTSGGAFLGSEEERAGMIRQGMLGDLVVLDGKALGRGFANAPSSAVWWTFVDGELVYMRSEDS